MFLNKYPLFSAGRILKVEMLDELRDFPRKTLDMLFEKYSNGIICGCSIEASDDHITVKKGLIKHNGVIYMLKKDTQVPYVNTDKAAILKVKFAGEDKTGDFIRYASEFLIDSDFNLQSHEMELCRYKLKTGARLRTSYISLEDMSTEYDTVNIINTPFAAVEKPSISPYVLKQFAREAFQYNLTNPFDISFCMLCLGNGEVLEKEMIVNYVANRLRVRGGDLSNEDIYEYLLRILSDIREGGEAFGKSRRIDFKKIIVD
ncbi:MAG: hypothetical protein AB6733_24395 [Clostridiaceae bacterium]